MINFAEVPLNDSAWKSTSLRERLRITSLKVLRDNAFLPVPAVISTYVPIGLIWWFGFQFLFMDTSVSLLTELNMKKFLIYQILHGLLGLGATSSLLGFRFKWHLGGTGIHFLMPGSLCSPLLPKLAQKLSFGLGASVPGQRSFVAVLSFAVYIALLLRALLAKELGVSELLPIYLVLVLCTIFDFTIYLASRGEHYVYMLVCLVFPDWRSGMQCVQLALWCWAGISKMGPWFQYVLPFITKDSAVANLLPREFLAKILLADYPRDVNPSRFTTVLAWTGAFLEVIFPAFCSCSAPLRYFGGYGMIWYHTFIGLCMPFASVFEWNFFCMILAYYLFVMNQFSLPSSLFLQVFLTLVLVVVPVVGQLYPKLVPFLLAYRPYAGNWRFQWYILHKTALPKHQKLKTMEDPFTGNNLGWMYKTLFGKWGEASKSAIERWDWFLTASIIYVPAYRPLVSILEKLCEENKWDIDDVLFAHSEGYQNQVFGWSLGTGWIATRECTREAFNTICKFEKAEMYFVQFEPCKPLPYGEEHHVVQFRCFDVTEGPENAQIHGAVPYAQLAACQPAGLYLSEAQTQRGRSINGTFLSTYF